MTSLSNYITVSLSNPEGINEGQFWIAFEGNFPPKLFLWLVIILVTFVKIMVVFFTGKYMCYWRRIDVDTSLFLFENEKLGPVL